MNQHLTRIKLILIKGNSGNRMLMIKKTIVTLLDGILKHKSLKICTSFRAGYLKLTCCNSILPCTVTSVIPSSELASILDFRSISPKIETAASPTLLKSRAVELDCETPTAIMVRAKNTCIFMKR